MQTIKIFGVGCLKYRDLLAELKRVIDAYLLPLRIEEVDDLQQFFEYKIEQVPALVLDRKVVLSGKIVPDEALYQLIKAAM